MAVELPRQRVIYISPIRALGGRILVGFAALMFLIFLILALTKEPAAFFIVIGLVVFGPMGGVGWFLLRGQRVVFDLERGQIHQHKEKWSIERFHCVVIREGIVAGRRYSSAGFATTHATVTVWSVNIETQTPLAVDQTDSPYRAVGESELRTDDPSVEGLLVYTHTSYEKVRDIAEELSALTGLSLCDKTPA